MLFRVFILTGLVGLIGLAGNAGCGGCDHGGFPVDAAPIDAPAPGTVSVAWSLTDLMGDPITCEQVGATTVFVELHARNSGSGVGVSLSCGATPGTSQPLEPGTYDASFELHAGSTTLATVADQNGVVVSPGHLTTLSPVAFKVDAVGSLVFSIKAPPHTSNCSSVGGAGITATTMTLLHTGDGCAPVTFTRSRGATTIGSYVVNCSSPVVTTCIENDEALTAANIASGPYTIHIVGKVGANDCWKNDNSLQVPPQRKTLSDTLNVAHQTTAGCTP
jgi:hypothetical protein